ncbi:MAG: hypothetical protein KTQ13_07970 [Ferruginibacter sp.]|nr:hypothetical protein [Chitinophagaceae bacterium]MBP6285776.1 hypothetical protein [Ferruginibacter sp.]MBU9936570.1 hypothetical protein [Ferruginibacter sp.]
MKHRSKLTLSAEELQLVNNTGWILTKHAVIGKLYGMFGQLSENYRAVVEQVSLPVPVARASAKISKGENYRQLPYVMLDYPRCFEGENIFAVRTMFWWGNFFSLTLQLSGTYKTMFEKDLCSGFDRMQRNDFYVCVNDDPWQHHFEENNYCSVGDLTREEFEKRITQEQFVKLAVRFPLDAWNEIPKMLEAHFREMMQLLNDQLPRR